MKRIKSNGVVALVVSGAILLSSIGLILAREGGSSYHAPDLMLTQGQAAYDLLDGITYDGEKYELSVCDEGGFDVNVPGSYTVEYVLTPVEQPPAPVLPAPEESAAPAPEESAAPAPVESTPPESTAPETTPPEPTETASETSPDQTLPGPSAPPSGGGQAPETPPEAALEAIHFSRTVVVREAAQYEDVRFDIGTAADLLTGMDYDAAHYALAVLDGDGFDGGRVGEYHVAYRLTNTDNGLTVADLARYVWVTAPGVSFDAPELSLVLRQSGYDLRDGIQYDAAAYTLTPEAETVDTSVAGELRVMFTMTESGAAEAAAIFGRNVRVADGPMVIIDAPPLTVMAGATVPSAPSPGGS